MIAVDASAVLAILFDEPEAKSFRQMLAAEGGVMSPVNHWEVLARARVKLGPTGPSEADALMGSLMITVLPTTVHDSRRAISAFVILSLTPTTPAPVANWTWISVNSSRLKSCWAVATGM